MKIRAIAAAAAALVILAACGGSETSSTTATQRTKNAALDIKSCEQGGFCALGAKGPNGGFVYATKFFNTSNELAEIREAAFNNFDFLGEVGPLCSAIGPRNWSQDARPASGANDTTTLANKCEGGPAVSLAGSGGAS